MDDSSTSTLLTWNQIKGSEKVLNSQPKLKDLYNLITPEYAAHWKVIGTLLGIKKGILDGIERNFPSNVSWCCNKLLETWLERDIDASWKKVVQVINSSAVIALRTSIVNAPVDSQQGEPPIKKQRESTPLNIAATTLRATYLTQTPPAQNDWPNYRVTKYVRLALIEKPEKTYRADHEHHIGMLRLRDGVDKIQTEKRQLNFDDLNEIFCNSNNRLILIIGNPADVYHAGIGKTTLANEICLKWANNNFLSKAFDIVIMLLLRSIQHQSTEEVFEKVIGKGAFQDLIASLGERCLIILEGLDEITLERQQSDQFLIELISSKLLQYSTIVITSRPHACQELMKKADSIIEILGFGNKEITDFVQESFPLDKIPGKMFLQQLQEHPQLYSICHVPISLAMIIDIFKEMKSLPLTLTELYYRFMVMMLVRENEKVKEKNQIQTPVAVLLINITEEEILHQALPDVPKEKLKNVFLLSKLAFHGFFTVTKEDQSNRIVKRINLKIIFNQNDLIQCGIVSLDNYDGHSLLKMETLHHFAGSQKTFNFIHLTAQEFLCAVYMLTLSQEEQLCSVQEYFNVYPNVIIFYCGLTKLDLHHIIYSELTTSSSLTAVKCLYEGQRNTDLHKLTSPFLLNIKHTTLLPYDCLCVSYVLCHYSVTRLNLFRCYIGDNNAQILAKWCLNKKDTRLQELNLHGNKLTSEGMKHVMNIVTSSPSLKVLNVSFNNIGTNGISSCLLHIKTLAELRVVECGISVEGASYIKTMLMENTTLPYLDIGDNKIGDDGVGKISKGLQHNNTLTKLDAWKCGFSVEGSSYIKKMLMENKRLQYLNIGSNKIGDDGVRYVTEGLQYNNTLTELWLNNCDVSVQGAISISKMITINHTLQILNISLNSIGDEGIAAIAGALNDATISELNVYDCNVTITGAKSLAAGLANNNAIKLLDVMLNDITEDGAIAILEAAVDNEVCQDVWIDSEYKSNDKVKDMMIILEKRKIATSM